MATLAVNLQTGFTRVATEFKSQRTLITGSATGDLSGLATTNKSSLVAAINEAREAGGAQNLDGLTDVVITTPAEGQILYRNATGWVNVAGSTYYQPRDADLDTLAAATLTGYGVSLLGLAGAAALTAAVVDASTATAGKVLLATDAQTATGTATDRAVTPASAKATYQPLDADLTAIAALATATFGRGLLTLADAAALTATVVTATTALAGKVLLASTSDATTGTDTAKAVTAAGVKAAIDQRIDNTSALGTSTTNAPSQAAVKAYADGLLDANNAYQFKGGIDASTNPNYPAASAGHTYRVTVAGRIGGASGERVEVNDTLTCLVDGTASGTQAAVGANWLITQTNIDGAVTGPATSTSGSIAIFSGTTGRVIADSGFSVDSDGALTANSAARVPTQSAVRAYAQPLDAELTALAGLASAADRLPYFTGSGNASLATFTAFGRSLVDDADAAAARTTLGLGTAATQNSGAFQTADATLTALAGLTTAADQMIYATGVDTFAVAPITTFARSLLDDADAATARATLQVYGTADIGDTNTDFAAQFAAALL